MLLCRLHGADRNSFKDVCNRGFDMWGLHSQLSGQVGSVLACDPINQSCSSSLFSSPPAPG